MAVVRLFVAEADSWSELTDGAQDAAPTVRISATDLAQARRQRTRIKAEDDSVAVILDVTVAVAGDFRTARRLEVAAEVPDGDAVVRYVGTADGLAGLLDDIESAGVADGVTLIPAGSGQNLRALGADVLHRLELRGQARRAS
ncbi:hypothetical protein [Mycolicibacterium goodii]|uniref:Uncharacterized protein n=1 Tax=Mycolicibacterium goodii TaxID=134601 RepID=A0A0K0XFS5_MYCGD|nr:hypothetical protein AFA91_10045 [Mycolicibacterium goodii]